MRKAIFGDRNSIQSHKKSEKPFLTDCNYQIFKDANKKYFVCNTRLIVTDSFLFGCKLDEISINEGVQFLQLTMDWSTNILNMIDDGSIDIAVFNEEKTKHYIENNNNNNFKVVKHLGYSMGGRCFSAIVRKDSDLLNLSHPELVEKILSKNIYVGIHSDRFDNFCHFIEMSPEDALKNINFIDIPDPNSLDIFKADKNAVIVGGQNIRFAAYFDENFCELLNYNTISSHCKTRLLQSSSNCLLFSNSLINNLNISPLDFANILMENFKKLNENEDDFTSLIKQLMLHCKIHNAKCNFDTIIKHIIFETYRIGKPQW